MNHCLRAIHAWCDAALTRRERSRTSAPGRTATTPPRNRATSRCILSENTKLERHAVTHAKRNTRWHLDLLWRPPPPLPPLQHSKAVFRSICSGARRLLLLRSETEPRTLWPLFPVCTSKHEATVSMRAVILARVGCWGSTGTLREKFNCAIIFYIILVLYSRPQLSFLLHHVSQHLV